MTQGEFETDCRNGPHKILMKQGPDGKWKPFSLDGTPHNCRAKKPDTPKGQIGFLSDAMKEAVRQIVREELGRE